MRVLIVEAEGWIGRAAVRQLQLEGMDVLVFGLSPNTASRLFLDRTGVRPIQVIGDGQLDVAGDAPGQLARLDAILVAADRGPGKAQDRLTRLIAVASQNGRPHLIQIATADAVRRRHAATRDSEGPGPLDVPAIPTTTLLPTLLDSTMLEHAAEIATTGQWRGSAARGAPAFIDPRDVVACARAVVMKGRGLGRVQLTGPRHLSYAEVAGALSTILHREITYEAVSPEDQLADLLARGLSHAQAADWVSRDAMTESQSPAPLTDSVLALTGRAPGSLAAYLEDHRCAFADGGMLE
ncbi:hypothetical protein [Phenylobacterium sp.]|uniref:hypothetical protein n=1 Tax=Phenylobacterium sp. TaxID=1871053 RepID=UPI0012044D3B|nr:hypothetical protein [Phenylobacterium sp.]THD60580.1 MAG: hypothetical protein E8A49_14235 [Phenylobacterium sp.]